MLALVKFIYTDVSFISLFKIKESLETSGDTKRNRNIIVKIYNLCKEREREKATT